MKVTMEMNQVLKEQGDLLYRYLETILQGMIFLNSFTLLQMDRLQLTAVYCNRRGDKHDADANDSINDCVTLHDADVNDNINDCVALHDAYTTDLDGSAGHRIVDLVQGGKVVSVLHGRVVRQSLLGNCPGAPTPGRLLALRDVLLGFLLRSKRTAHLDVPGLVRVLPGAHFFPDLPSSRAT